MNKFKVGFVLALGLVAGNAVAGDIEAGKAKAGVCAACHGADGIALIPGYPNLKGQSEQYMISAIKAYKNGQRTGGTAPVMQAQASMLSDDDINNLAAYFASLK